MPIFAAKKSLFHADISNVPGGNLPNQVDNMSAVGKCGTPLVSLASKKPNLKTFIVHLIDNYKASELLKDCKTLSRSDLRKKYPREASSHGHMLERAPKYDRFVNPAWRKFKDFLLSMGLRPEGTTLDRIDNDDPEYGPGKCRWAAPHVQNNNKSDTLVFKSSVDGQIWSTSELAKRYSLSPSTIAKRRSRGKWTDDEIIKNERHRRSPRNPNSNSTAIPQIIPNVPPTASHLAKSPDFKLVDCWEAVMRELKPNDIVTLSGFERGRLSEFGRYFDNCSLRHRQGDILIYPQTLAGRCRTRAPRSRIRRSSATPLSQLPCKA